jgi:hypothetical protein
VRILFVSPPSAFADDSLAVYYAGPAGAVSTALTLDKGIHLVSDASTADAFVFNDVIPDDSAISARLAQGAGLVLILGPDITDSQLANLLGEQVDIEFKDDPLSLTTSSTASDPILKDIVWTSAPQIRSRDNLTGSSFTPLVIGYEDGSLVLGNQGSGQGSKYLFTAFLNGDNPQFQEWAYFISSITWCTVLPDVPHFLSASTLPLLYRIPVTRPSYISF